MKQDGSITERKNHIYCFSEEEIDRYLGETMKHTLMDIIRRIERDRSLEKGIIK
ncbi:hypothetical protein [Clostridium sp. AWRP]|uniref:hypothetical protein n=1 Tax=Clostridium sp. AWRP TaxID=2212991 RepID=UPI0015863800|nr:hypothetical protein [Clostridium sp. AWRP]